MKIFNKFQYDVLSSAEFRLFSDGENYSLPQPESETGKSLLSIADIDLESEIPQLYASIYRRHFVDGNRTEYEKSYFKRRTMLKNLFFGELISDSGKYISKIIDLIWLIMEETTWVIPAHNHFPVKECKKNDSIGNEFCGNAEYLDLFSAETGAIIATVYYFFKNKIDEFAPVINERIMYELHRRIIIPYKTHRDFFWMSLDGQSSASNWTAWITSNVLTVTALVEEDTEMRKDILDKALECLDEFIDSYAEDGGCSEGPSYWKQACGSLFNSLEIIYDMTGGQADIFTHPLIYNMMDYIRKVHLSGFHYSNFADCRAELYKLGLPLAIRMGMRTKNNALYDFGLENTPEHITETDRYEILSELKNICMNIPEKKSKYVPDEFNVLENLQVAVQRSDNGFICAVKGGHNRELHNHNDVGNVIVMYNDDPLFIDIGVATYTKFSFGSARYTLFPMNSNWHNLPEVNGFTQQNGEEFRSDLFYAEKGKFVVEYESAYKKEANIIKAKREILFSENELCINETLDFKGENAIFRYYMRECPSVSDGLYTFSNGIKMTVPENCKITSIPIDDPIAISGWNTNTLYCLSIEVTPQNSHFTVKLSK